MAIKMKHSGNATATTFASMGGGEGKRRAEDAKAFAQIAASRNAAANRQLQGAHASPISATAPHAQLISAPTGGGAHAIPGPGGIGATARLGGGAGASSRAGRTSGSSGSGSSPAEEDYKVTGTDRFSRPDDDSVWNDYTKQWQRKWLPGEKEAEALQRVLSVKDDFANIAADRELKGKITFDNLRTQNAIGKYIQQKRADVVSNPNIETLKGQLENARNTLFKSIAEKARGVPVSTAGGQNAGTDISAAITPPQGEPQPSAAGRSFDYGTMLENGGHFFGEDGVANSGSGSADSSTLDSLYNEW